MTAFRFRKPRVGERIRTRGSTAFIKVWQQLICNIYHSMYEFGGYCLNADMASIKHDRPSKLHSCETTCRGKNRKPFRLFWQVRPKIWLAVRIMNIHDSFIYSRVKSSEFTRTVHDCSREVGSQPTRFIEFPFRQVCVLCDLFHGTDWVKM